MPKNKTPLALYKKKTKEGALKSDAAQERAASELQRLYDELLDLHNRPKKSFFERATRFILPAEAPPKGVYIHGGVGRGKSMLMDMFFECLPDDLPRRRAHFHEFMIEVHDYIHTRREVDNISDGVDAALPALAARIAEHTQVLCFDEFHVTDVADAMILGRLFTALFDLGVITVCTSNWPPERLYEGGLQRDRFLPFIDLLKERLEIIHLDSPTDYRKQCLVQEGSYFWPLGKETETRIEGVFRHFTDSAPVKSESFTVKGRKINVKTAAKGAARFTFAQLCEKPHGAEDYLGITKRYNAVFLENVPKLAPNKRNEAKRLMTLIDVLYEAGTKLVISADVPPDQIYGGKDHAFEFERTISRLLEMQSLAYLER